MDDDYSKLPGLEHIYLEDSYVLEIEEGTDSLKVTLEAVLTETHPEYSTPKAGEQYCYRDAVLEFTSITECKWDKKDLGKVTTDSDGTQDHGNIDTLGILPNGYYVEGDFGTAIIITTASPKLTLKT